ncbi:MAG: transcription termination/antitermination protein NusG [Lysobacteraceae bacterium]
MKGFVQSVHRADPWLVLRTKSRHESKVEVALQQKQVETYLPRRRIQRSMSSRRSVVEMPLFPGYVFVRPRPEQYEGMRYVPGSCGLVLSAGRAAVLPDRDVDVVRRLVDSGHDYDARPELLLGTRVRIVSGPLAGMEGELVRLKQQELVVINVDVVGSSVRVEVDRDAVVVCS